MLYLYLKTHNKTGLKYLGKTTQDPFKYKGSGKYWKRHIKKHGKDISTNILLATESKQELIETGIYFSRLWNVVKSPEFANLKEENGDGGSDKGRKLSEEHKEKISNTTRGTNNPFYGKIHSNSTKKRISNSLVGQTSPMKNRKMPKTAVIKKYKKTVVNGVVYNSAKEAAKVVGIPYSTVTRNCKSDKFPNFYYILK
jgi:group I intron endonuclease